jgi:hypothetical protein
VKASKAQFKHQTFHVPNVENTVLDNLDNETVFFDSSKFTIIFTIVKIVVESRGAACMRAIIMSLPPLNHF